MFSRRKVAVTCWRDERLPRGRVYQLQGGILSIDRALARTADACTGIWFFLKKEIPFFKKRKRSLFSVDRSVDLPGETSSAPEDRFICFREGF